VISPVMARSRRTGILLSALAIAVAMVMPADVRPLNCAFGHVHVQIESAVEIAGQAETMRPRSDIGQGGLPPTPDESPSLPSA